MVEVSHLREVLANVSGAVSIACWVTILLPQLLEQWRLKSADGVAIGFLLAWFFGDIANLAGSLLGHLRPSVVLLALWFCFSDTLLVLSYWYYKQLNAAPAEVDFIEYVAGAEPSPSGGSGPNYGSTSPKSQHSVVTEGSGRGSVGSAGSGHVGSIQSTPLLEEPHEEETTMHVASVAATRGNWLLSTGLPAIFVLVVATLSYFVSDSAGQAAEPAEPANAGAEALGYVSAALYICARVPQMVQNHRRRSVEGLSMGFFTLSLVGNLTYAGQVVLYRTDRDWLITYVPWLLGSLGTVLEDLVILGQFYYYRPKNRVSIA